jgi:uncharacterized cupredoxin-like copper-binding protein
MDIKRQADISIRPIERLLLVIAILIAVGLFSGSVGATSHGCFAVETADGDGDATSTYLSLESVDDGSTYSSETTADSSCSRDSATENNHNVYIFDVPSGDYYLQVYDSQDTSELWGVYEVSVPEQGVTDVETLERGAVYTTDYTISSPRDTARFQPGETATLNIDVYNGQRSGSDDYDVTISVHEPSGSTVITTDTFNYDVFAEQGETITPEFTVPEAEGEYEVSVVIETDTAQGEFVSDEFSAGTIGIEVFEPPQIESRTPSNIFVTTSGDESTAFSVSATDPNTPASSLEYTWYVDDQEVATGDDFILDPSEYGEGEHFVEVVVADETAETQDVSGYWTVNITHDPPVIETMTPSDSVVDALGGVSPTLSVTASDPDSSDLLYTWYVDGEEVTTGPSFTFDPSDYNGGEYNATVVVSDGTAATEDVSHSWTIDVIEAPEVEVAEPDDSEVDIGSSVTFSADATDPGDNTPLEYQWTIAGETYEGDEVSQTITSTDEVAAEVEVTNSQGVSTSQSIELNVDTAPPNINSLTGGGTEITAGDSITLSATASDPDDRDIGFTYNWSVINSTYYGSNITISPGEVGQHDVELTVTNEYGSSTSQTTTLIITNDIPELTMAGPSNRSFPAGQSDSLTVTMVDNDASETNLSFSVDGETIEERNITQPEADETFSYQFDTPGEYSVEVTAVDGNGASTTVGWTVNVTSRPPEFTDWSPEESSLSVLSGETITFNATASDADGQSVAYQWYVDGNYTTSGQTLSNQFARHGQYTVRVVASDPDNTTKERTWDVDVRSFNRDLIIDPHVSSIVLNPNSSTEFATVSVSNPEANSRAAEVELLVHPPSGLSVTSVESVQSGNPSQYRVSDSVSPGDETSLSLGLQLDNDSLLGQTVTVDYSVIYYPAGQRADSVVLENSTTEIAVGPQAAETQSSARTTGGAGDGFTVLTAVTAMLVCVVARARRYS